MLYLIFLDLFWSLAALIIDLPKLPEIPVWAWPFAVVCPIYPFLLFLVWRAIYKGREPNPYLLAFAVIGSAVFGLLALLFYPAVMTKIGFDWRSFGQIFWVLFYSLQGWYLLFKKRLLLGPAATVGGFLLVKFYLDYRFETFGYLGVEDLPAGSIFYLFVLAVALSFVLCLSAVILARRAK